MPDALPAPKPRRLLWRAVRISLLLFALAAFALAFLAAVRLNLLVWAYTRLLAWVIDTTGMDLWLARAWALLLLTLLALLPWHLLVLPWIGSLRRQVAVMALTAAFLLAFMHVVTHEVYFSRADGRPLKHYVLTLDGYKFSATRGTDPVYGLPYRPITPLVAREYILWKRRGGNLRAPDVLAGVHFDANTGEPLRWFSRTPQGRIDLFALPGFHPTYGTRLEPVNAAVAAEYERQEAEARQKAEDAARRQNAEAAAQALRRKEAEALAKARQDARQRAEDAHQRAKQARQRAEDAHQRAKQARQRAEEAARVSVPLRPGRYVFGALAPRGTVDGLRFALTEVDLTAASMVVHMNVQNLGPDPDSRRFWRSGDRLFRFLLLFPDGRSEDFKAIRFREGAIAQEARAITFPPISKRGAFVMEFPPFPPATETFSISINDEPLISGVNLRRVPYLPF